MGLGLLVASLEQFIVCSAVGGRPQSFFLEWLQHFQKNVLGGVSPENPHFLLLDGHASHVTEEAVILAMQMGLQIALLPPHSSHQLQSLDVGIFWPFKMRFGQMREDEITSNPRWLNGENNKFVVATLASRSMTATCTIENIKYGFRKRGVFPFNPGALDEDYGPSSVFAPEEHTSLECCTKNDFEDFNGEGDSRFDLEALEPETSRSLEEGTTFGALIVMFEFLTF